eukprot:scaffold57841_cov58-Phaeocystis_antarctica.AAC.4
MLRLTTSKVVPADANAKSNQKAVVGVGSVYCVGSDACAPDASSIQFTSGGEAEWMACGGRGRAVSLSEC